MNGKLLKIRKEIKRKLKDNFWLFSDYNILWDGEIKVFFIAEVPSGGTKPGNLDTLINLLKKYRLEGAYITDLIKKNNLDSITVKKLEKSFWELDSNVHRDILEMEIKEVSPCLIVAIGNSVERVLRSPNFLRDIPVEKIRHYSQTNRKELEKEINRISRIYFRLRI